MRARYTKLKVILTHDVDYPPQGPGRDHVLARRGRFDQSTLDKVLREGFNPYNNINSVIDIEESFGVRSTFFFRPAYDDGTQAVSYADDMKILAAGGWEIGAHINDASDLNAIRRQKAELETCAGTTLLGCRVHYLKVNQRSYPLMEEAGFSYDSSLMFSKDTITENNAGYLRFGKIVVFPITIMDAYLFTYMRISEEHVIDVFKKAMDVARHRGYMTVLWHDSSLRMKGGRMYSAACKYLASREDVELIRAQDAFLSVSKEDPE